MWYKPSDKLPDDEQICVLLAESGALIGPIGYKINKDSKDGWLDLFGPNSSPEGGMFVPFDKEGLAYWRDAQFLELPDDYAILMKKST